MASLVTTTVDGALTIDNGSHAYQYFNSGASAEAGFFLKHNGSSIWEIYKRSAATKDFAIYDFGTTNGGIKLQIPHDGTTMALMAGGGTVNCGGALTAGASSTFSVAANLHNYFYINTASAGYNAVLGFAEATNRQAYINYDTTNYRLNLVCEANNGSIYLLPNGSGNVNLYYGAANKLQTVTGGVNVNGTLTSSAVTTGAVTGTTGLFESSGGANTLTVSTNSGAADCNLDLLEQVAGVSDGIYGARIRYDGSANKLHIGTVAANSETIAMTVNRGSSDVTVIGALTIGAYTLPNTDGTTGYHLQTNGSGTVTWQPGGGGTVTGSGTDNYIPRWNGTTALHNSIIYDSGASVGISSVAFSSPAGTLHTQAVGSNITYLDAYSATPGTGSMMIFRKSASATVGKTQTGNGDSLGTFTFYGVNSNPSPDWGLGAAINISQEGTSGASYVPAHMAFSTCTASAYGERMRIASDGNVGINCSSNLPAKLNVVGAGADGVAMLGMSESDQANIEFGFFGNFLGSGETGNSLYIGSANGGSWLANIMEWRGDGRTTLNGPTITALTAAAGSGALLAPSGSTNILNKRTKELFGFSVGPGTAGLGGTAKNVADEENRTTTGSWGTYGIQVQAVSKVAWLKVDCLTKYRVTSFAVSSYPGGAHKPGGDWVVQGSNDDSSWTTLGTGNYRQWKPYGFTGSDYTGTYPFDPQQIVRCTTVEDYRYFRIYADNFSDSGTNNYLLVMNWGLFVGGTQQDTFQRPIETSKPIRMAAGSYLIGEPTNGVRLNNSADTLNLIVAKNDGDVHMPGRLAIGGTTHVAGKWLTVIGPSSFSDSIVGTSAIMSGHVTIGNTLKIYSDNTSTDPGMPYMRSDGNYLCINSDPNSQMYIQNDGTGDLYLCEGGGNVYLPAASSDLIMDGSAYVRNANNNAILLGKGTRWGYSSGYKAIQIGDASGTYTVCIGYDPAGNANGSFTGDGGELLFRNDMTFVTPNAADNAWHKCLHFKDGNVTVGSAATPAYKLDVQGTFRVTGAATFDTTIIANTSITLADGSGSNVGALTILGGNNLTICGIQTNHCGFSFATNSILPCTQGATNTGVVDLGASSEKYKDLYLGGTLMGTLGTFSGNLGIGIADPGTYELNVNGEIYSSGTVTIANNKYYAGLNTSGAMYALLKLNASNQMEIGATNMAAAGYPARVLAKYITFEPAGNLGAPVETMRVTNGSFNGVGSVGIGTTTPSMTLEVAGQMLLKSSSPEFDWVDTGAASNEGRWRADVNNSGTWTLKATNDAISDSNDAISITRSGYVPQYVNFPNGKVGIGTTAPDRKFHVVGTDEVARFTGTDANPPTIEFENSTGVQAKIGLKSGHDFIIDTAGEDIFMGAAANEFTIKADGKVGIGTTAPSSTLSIYNGGAAWSSANLSEAVSGAIMEIAPLRTGSSAGIYFGNVSSTIGYIQGASTNGVTSYDFCINPYGSKVGIGTTAPECSLQVEKLTGGTNIRISAGNYGTNYGQFELDSISVGLSSGNNVRAITINHSNQYVGINDTTPTYMLDVNGTFRVTGASVLGNISSTLNPTSDSTYNLGGNTTRWASVFADTLYGAGSNITSLNGSNISSGTVAAGRLGSGSSITSKFLRGDNTWQTVSSGGDTVTIDETADDILSVSAGDISGVDANTDKLVYWDEGLEKLKYLTFSDLTALP